MNGEDGVSVPRQDKDASSVVCWFSGAVVLLGALTFDQPCPAMVLFGAEGLVKLSIAYGIQWSVSPGVICFDPSTPKVSRVGYTMLFAQNTARWLIAMKVLLPDHKKWEQAVYGIVYIVLFLPYLFSTVLRHPRRVQQRTAGLYTMGSSGLVGLVLVASHLMRRTRFAHQRDDHRLMYSGLSQLTITMLIWPGSKKLPAWVLEVANLLCWVVFWVCSGHKHLIGTEANALKMTYTI